MRAALIAGLAVLACVAVLLTDYVVATRRAPRDDQLLKSLEQQVKNDAALATRLASEQKRVTEARLARKSRDNGVAWALIASAAAFLICAKRLVLPSAPPPLPARAGPVKKAGQGAGRGPGGPPHKSVDQIIAEQGTGREAAIAILQAVQAGYGYLPEEALRRVCELTEVTPAQIAGAASFYGQFRRSPVGKHIVRVCHGTACHVAGARQVTEELRRSLRIPGGADTDPDRLFTLEEVACLGCCSLAPVLMVDGRTAGRLTPASAREAIEETA